MHEYQDYDEEACKALERGGNMPAVGLSVDRRVLGQLQEAFNEESVQCLVCFMCAEKSLRVQGFARNGERQDIGEIAYRRVSDLEAIVAKRGHEGAFKHNLCCKTFRNLFATACAEDPPSALAEAPELREDCWE